jgi:heat shock protein HslJ
MEIVRNTKLFALAGMILVALSLSACVPIAPVQVPAPAAATAQLTAQPWQWESFQGATEEFKVDASAQYTATFAATFAGDGSLKVTADCNKASGTYSGEGGALTIKIGPMTQAACPPGSRSDQFVKLLGSAARYFIKDGKLYIDLFADGGTMAFAPAR